MKTTLYKSLILSLFFLLTNLSSIHSENQTEYTNPIYNYKNLITRYNTIIDELRENNSCKINELELASIMHNARTSEDSCSALIDYASNKAFNNKKIAEYTLLSLIDYYLTTNNKNYGPSTKAHISYKLGTIANQWNEYSIAKSYLLKSKQFFYESKDLNSVITCLNYIGCMGIENNNLEMAKDCFHEALNILKTTNNLKDYFTTYNNLGIIYSKQNNLIAALDNYLLAHSNLPSNNNDLLFVSNNNIACIYIKMNKLDESESYLNRIKIEDLSVLNKVEFLLTQIEFYIAKQDLKETNIIIQSLNKIFEEEDEITKDARYYEILINYFETSGFKNKQRTILKEYVNFLKNSYTSANKNIKPYNLHALNLIIELKFHTIKQQIVKSNKRLKIFHIVIIILSIILFISISLLLVIKIKHRNISSKLSAEINQLNQNYQSKLENLKIKADFQEDKISSLNGKNLSSAILITKLESCILKFEQLLNIIKLTYKSSLAKTDQFVEAQNALNTFNNRIYSKEFERCFEEIHPDFYKKLLLINSKLTKSDLRLAALIKLNFDTKEIASILHMEIRSVESARSRLKKKLKIEGSSLQFLFNL